MFDIPSQRVASKIKWNTGPGCVMASRCLAKCEAPGGNARVPGVYPNYKVMVVISGRILKWNDRFGGVESYHNFFWINPDLHFSPRPMAIRI